MRLSERMCGLLAPFSAGLISAWLLACVIGVKATVVNDYLRYGFVRSFPFIVQTELARFLLPCVVAAFLLAGITWTWARRRRRRPGEVTGADVGRLVARLLGGGAGLAFFLRLAYVHNRYRFAHLWRRQTDVCGVSLPKALFVGDVWRANAVILLGAIATAVVVWLAVRWVLGRHPAPAWRFWRRLGGATGVAIAVALVAVPFLVGSLLRRQMSDLPNIILVSIDTLRADRLGVYGYARDTSPEMDRLASDSFVFEWALSPAPNTAPSHMSMFTSLYPTVHGFTGNGDRLAGWRLTLTEYLREKGYRTVATTDGAYMRGWFGFGQGFERFSDFNRKGIAKSVALTLRWIDSGLADSPFFAFVHCYDVHSPYDPPLPYRDLYTDPGYDGGFYPGSMELEAVRQAVKRNPEGGHGLSPADVEFISARYDGGIRYTDYWMGELVDGLVDRGLHENTWLFVTSDHGEEFTEHGSVLHEKLYHTVTHVPLIVRPPGPSRPGRRIAEIAELTDLMPTIMEIGGVEPVRPVQGRSLVRLMDGEGGRPGNASGDPDRWKNVAFSELPWFGQRRAITTPRLHVITSIEGQEIEAYAYHDDPLEQSSLDDSARAEETAEVLRLLMMWHEEQASIARGDPAGTEPAVLHEAAREELRALGYIY